LGAESRGLVVAPWAALTIDRFLNVRTTSEGHFEF
jgi:hypothetical protein